MRGEEELQRANTERGVCTWEDFCGKLGVLGADFGSATQGSGAASPLGSVAGSGGISGLGFGTTTKKQAASPKEIKPNRAQAVGWRRRWAGEKRENQPGCHGGKLSGLGPRLAAVNAVMGLSLLFAFSPHFSYFKEAEWNLKVAASGWVHQGQLL